MVAGHGLSYNPGEHVMGFTSLPWTLWSALGIFLRIDPAGWTRATSVAADLATLVVGGRMLGSACGRASVWTFTSFFSVWPLFAASSASGMESSAFLALIVIAAFLVERRSPWGGPALGLLAIFRPEGLPAALLIALAADGRARLVALAVVAATAGVLTAWFGSPVPQSLVAKATLYGTPGAWVGRLWWEWLLPFPLGRFPTATEGVQMLPAAAIFAASLVRGAIELWRHRASAAARAAAAAIGIWSGYALLGVAYFWWYMVVPMAGFAFAAAAGFPRIVTGRWLPVACLLFLLGSWTVAPSLYLGRAQAEYLNFVAIADFLESRVQAGESMFLEPIGLIGFRNPIRVIDEIGLVSPEVARRRLKGAGWYADIVAEHRPDWLVIRSDVAATGQAFAGAGAPFRGAAERDSTFARYRLVLASDAEHRSTLAVYRRVR
jgi:hypothetical protein